MRKQNEIRWFGGTYLNARKIRINGAVEPCPNERERFVPFDEAETDKAPRPKQNYSGFFTFTSM